MTPEEAKIVLLEDALVQAIHTVEFLHGCLTEPSLEEVCRVAAAAKNLVVSMRMVAAKGEPSGYMGHSYSYPEQTEQHLADFRNLVRMPKSCHHSYYAPGRGEPCEACEDSKLRHQVLMEARQVLAQNCPPQTPGEEV